MNAFVKVTFYCTDCEVSAKIPVSLLSARLRDERNGEALDILVLDAETVPDAWRKTGSALRCARCHHKRYGVG